MEEKITLTKVNVVGRKWFHIFKMDDGTVQEVESTETDYRQLGTKTPVNPTIVGGKWHASYERYKFDTPDGDLSEGQYCDNGNDYLIKAEGHFIQAKKDELVKDSIDKVIVDTAIAEMVELEKRIAIK